MKYAACVEYNGTAYCGWQKLSHAPSIQAEVETALSFVANHPIDVVCAGRTDSGVHAFGQIIHFESTADRTLKSWLFGTNTNLPDDIVIHWIKPVDDNFHARFSALSRRYRYIIFNHLTRPALLHKRVTWFRYALDVQKMHQSCQYLLGEHDFSSFRASGCQAKHARREIQLLEVKQENHYIYIDIVANAFLHHMVRNIVGSLLVIGEAKKSPEWLLELRQLKDRTQAGITASACGLYFVQVHYPKQFNIPQTKHNSIKFNSF